MTQPPKTNEEIAASIMDNAVFDVNTTEQSNHETEMMIVEALNTKDRECDARVEEAVRKAVEAEIESNRISEGIRNSSLH
jgi:hypothetical protein